MLNRIFTIALFLVFLLCGNALGSIPISHFVVIPTSLADEPLPLSQYLYQPVDTLGNPVGQPTYKTANQLFPDAIHSLDDTMIVFDLEFNNVENFIGNLENTINYFDQACFMSHNEFRDNLIYSDPLGSEYVDLCGSSWPMETANFYHWDDSERARLVTHYLFIPTSYGDTPIPLSRYSYQPTDEWGNPVGDPTYYTPNQLFPDARSLSDLNRPPDHP